MRHDTTQPQRTIPQVRSCPKCGHSLRFIQFANETNKKLTCPDCGWRKPTVVEQLSAKWQARTK